MFMLNSFTNGLFGGANDVFSLATKFQDLRTKFRDWGNANEVERAMQTGPNDSGTGGLYGTSTTPSDATRPSGNSFDDDPELSKLPPLKKPEALKLSASSPSEGRGVYGRGQPGTPDSPREGKNYGGAPSDGALTASPENVVSGAYSAGKAAGSGLYDWLGSVGQRMRAFSATPQQQQPPPTYLPPEKPPNVGPAGAGGGAGPGTIDTLQQHGALMGGVGYPGGPNLAMQQSPLAPRIMSAINPGSVT